MKYMTLLVAVFSFYGLADSASTADEQAKASPIFSVKLPENYRKWQLIAPAAEALPLDELRVVLGNELAIDAYQQKPETFPDGTVLVKLAWQQRSLPGFPAATLSGNATTVQVMVKDTKRYPDSGGWGFGRFVNGIPADKAQHQSCFACHVAGASQNDYVFTQYAR